MDIEFNESNEAGNIVCPICFHPLHLSNSRLNCPNHGSFLFKDGIASFFSEDQLDFEEHWEAAENDPISSEKEKVAKAFLNSSPRKLQAKEKVLDAGCGDGVHLKVLQDYCPNSEMFGVDISKKALVRVKSLLGRDKLCLVKASIDQLPFQSGFFDMVLCFGVLAYTRSPKRSLKELIRVTKKGGIVGIWVLPLPKGSVGSILLFLRSFIPKLPRSLQVLIANFIVPFLSLLKTKSNINLFNSSWSQCREVVLVNLAPKTLHFCSFKEIEEIVLEAGARIVKVEESQPTTIWIEP